MTHDDFIHYCDVHHIGFFRALWLYWKNIENIRG